ncbi:MAG: helix-turn-helix domain-containing protein, partial [Leptolyngbyaceae cyanobacterium SM1_1_3]|nr:helix-turn-helix domain-containing protein [Leptolyngbyaceae cyanobacterium SM1_1_3]
MPRLSAPAISLSDSEQEQLESLANRPSTPQQIALRAKIILRAARGDSHGAIARAFGITKA